MLFLEGPISLPERLRWCVLLHCLFTCLRTTKPLFLSPFISWFWQLLSSIFLKSSQKHLKFWILNYNHSCFGSIRLSFWCLFRRKISQNSSSRNLSCTSQSMKRSMKDREWSWAWALWWNTLWSPISWWSDSQTCSKHW